ncbi:MAG: Na/Pi symporter, partial [Clostridia bacterium]|nr:Na/Pi symporter [Clostridia bacterium]
MIIFKHLSMAIGGITLFLLGLKFMSESMENIAGKKMQSLIKGLTVNRVSGVVTGTITTAVIQSSIATNIILVGFTSSGIMTFFEASSVIMGANIGTTVTAQLVSLSGKQVFDITAFGSIIAFLGFIMAFIKNKNVKAIGNVMVGFGMIFIGLDIVSGSVNYFKNYQEFRNIFLVKSDILLLINGIIITGIVQSSSAVTSIIIILASNGLLDFSSAMFLILGANIGTC